MTQGSRSGFASRRSLLHRQLPPVSDPYSAWACRPTLEQACSRRPCSTHWPLRSAAHGFRILRGRRPPAPDLLAGFTVNVRAAIGSGWDGPRMKLVSYLI